MKVAVGLRRVAAGKRTSGRRAAQIARPPFYSIVSHKAVNYIWYDYIFRLSCLIVLDIIKLSYDIFRYEGGSK